MSDILTSNFSWVKLVSDYIVVSKHRKIERRLSSSLQAFSGEGGVLAMVPYTDCPCSVERKPVASAEQGL